jgi:hypothetical protein
MPRPIRHQEPVNRKGIEVVMQGWGILIWGAAAAAAGLLFLAIVARSVAQIEAEKTFSSEIRSKKGAK